MPGPAGADYPGGQLFESLQEAFGVPFAVMELNSGALNHVTTSWLPIDLDAALPVVEEIARRGHAAILEDSAPLLVLVVPLPSNDEDLPPSAVAVATFVTQSQYAAEELELAAEVVKVDANVLKKWVATQPIWPSRAVEKLSGSIAQQVHLESENKSLRQQLTRVSQQLLQTFDELNLLHRINDRLSLAVDENQLLDLAIAWLSDVLPAECLLACTVATPIHATDAPRPDNRQWTTAGECPLPVDELDRFFDRLGPEARHSMVLLDHNETASPTWYYPSVREVISVPIPTAGGYNGWLLAINHLPEKGRANTDFGNLETSLLSSVASIVGMHSGNVRLYREQSAFFESVVRAFSSSLDAKDPYTRGHSERVARISVLLARKLGCCDKELNTIYLSGLLHDIGKIGIDDQVLRKPGQLTPEEYEHIKLHPTLGYNILKGVQRLEHVLPVVLHHHEAWDGSGYPGGLAQKDIPWLARIVAVADSFDAMSSDRPYRKGMPGEQLDAIFRRGRSKQWDPAVMDAFFAIRSEIGSIIEEDRELLSLDVCQWSAT